MSGLWTRSRGWEDTLLRWTPTILGALMLGYAIVDRAELMSQVAVKQAIQQHLAESITRFRNLVEAWEQQPAQLTRLADAVEGLQQELTRLDLRSSPERRKWTKPLWRHPP